MIAERAAKIEQLAAAVAQLQRNSSNSSNPPSSDKPKTSKPKPKQRPSKKRNKKRGGQFGHKPISRPLIKSDVSRTRRPKVCSCCGDTLNFAAIKTTRTVQVKVFGVRATVTEYVQETVACDGCVSLEQGELLQKARFGFIGPVLISVIALLGGRYRLFRLEMKQILFDMYGVDISTGKICMTEQRVCAAIAERQLYLPNQRQLYLPRR